MKNNIYYQILILTIGCLLGLGNYYSISSPILLLTIIILISVLFYYTIKIRDIEISFDLISSCQVILFFVIYRIFIIRSWLNLFFIIYFLLYILIEYKTHKIKLFSLNYSIIFYLLSLGLFIFSGYYFKNSNNLFLEIFKDKLLLSFYKNFIINILILISLPLIFRNILTFFRK